MILEVSPAAAQWYKKELHLEDGAHIKFFGKVYGTRDGFSFTMHVMEPSNALEMINVEGINFYIEKTDAWFFDDIKLKVDLDDHYKEPTFYTENR